MKRGPGEEEPLTRELYLRRSCPDANICQPYSCFRGIGLEEIRSEVMESKRGKVSAELESLGPDPTLTVLNTNRLEQAVPETGLGPPLHVLYTHRICIIEFIVSRLMNNPYYLSDSLICYA